jgi:hypothetical protein
MEYKSLNQHDRSSENFLCLRVLSTIYDISNSFEVGGGQLDGTDTSRGEVEVAPCVEVEVDL